MNATLHLATVANALHAAGVEVVFVGGATIALYLDGQGAAATRATEDIDCIVNCVLASNYADIQEKLRENGFTDCLDDDAPICRFVFRADGGVDVLVDVMPLSDILGFANRYYPGAVATAEQATVSNVAIRIPTPGYALATKVVAWLGRGNNDPMSSKDFEDIIALADGCKRLVSSVMQLPVDARAEVAAELAKLLARRDILDLVHGNVPRPANPARVQACMAVLGQIARIADSASG